MLSNKSKIEKLANSKQTHTGPNSNDQTYIYLGIWAVHCTNVREWYVGDEAEQKLNLSEPQLEHISYQSSELEQTLDGCC